MAELARCWKKVRLEQQREGFHPRMPYSEPNSMCHFYDYTIQFWHQESAMAIWQLGKANGSSQLSRSSWNTRRWIIIPCQFPNSQHQSTTIWVCPKIRSSHLLQTAWTSFCWRTPKGSHQRSTHSLDWFKGKSTENHGFYHFSPVNGGFRFQFSREPMTHSTETSDCEEDVGDAGELVHDDVAAGCTLLH